MENFIVSARKYRPSTFDTVVGQSSITTTLKNAITNHQIAQAYLFCGPRGVGKTTIARIFAKTINCQNPTESLEPCNECESCKAFNHQRSTNIHELDAASNNSVDNIRSLIDQVRIPPQVGKYSIYIIDEVHMLSAAAFNAFLKTLEEPPAHAIFILATTEKHKILPTILSRCQIFDFNRIKVDEMVSFLEDISQKESVDYEKDALTIIAQKADGAMRDALSIYDQVVSFSGEKISYQKVIENLNVLDYDYYFRLTDAFMQGNHSEALVIFNEILDRGFDAHQFINSLSKHFRDLLVSKDSQTLDLLEVGSGIRDKYKEQAANASVDFLVKALNTTNQYDVSYRSSMNQRLHVELAMIDLCNLEDGKKKARDESEDNSSGIKEKPSKEPAEQTKKASADSGSEAAGTKASAKPENDDTSKQAASSQNNIPDHPGTFSINQALKKGKEKSTAQPEEQGEAEEQPTTQTITGETRDFSQADLEEAWKSFAEQYREKPRLYNMLLSRKPERQEDESILFRLQNQLQQEQLTKIYNALLINLKQYLKNDRITIQMQLMDDTRNDTNKLYTDEDKFRFMEKKNKELTKLKQNFDLDFN